MNGKDGDTMEQKAVAKNEKKGSSRGFVKLLFMFILVIFMAIVFIVFVSNPDDRFIDLGFFKQNKLKFLFFWRK